MSSIDEAFKRLYCHKIYSLSHSDRPCIDWSLQCSLVVITITQRSDLFGLLWLVEDSQRWTELHFCCVATCPGESELKMGLSQAAMWGLVG